MTISGPEEHRPLLNDEAEASQRRFYRSVEIEMKNATASNGGGWLKPRKDALTYTWRDVNAYVSDKNRGKFANKTTIRRLLGITEKSPSLGHHILNNVTGIAHPGELTVIMGSSGAGKTTLLNSLTFRTKTNTTVTGSRIVNGYPVDRATVTSLSAYVQQDDMFLESLTVREHLLFQAMVRMDETVPRRHRIRRVDEVIDELGLRRCEHTVIRDTGDSSGISGGERKRLSFASEILTDPPMLFCDEPTSGLDSVMALNVISVLKTMAQKGKTVVCTIHQPSSEMYNAFDKIILLADGRIAFLGSREEAAEFFASMGVPCPEHYNPADFYIHFLAVVPYKEDASRETIAAVCDSFEQSPFGMKLTIDVGMRHETETGHRAFQDTWRVVKRYKASWVSQFQALLWRSWLCVIKDPMLVKMRLFQNLVVAIVISTLYFQQKNDEDGVFNINGVIFTFLTNMTFQNVFAVMTVFCSERPIFLREHFSGMYRVDVYFLCKTLAEIPIFLALPVMFTVITYFTIGLNPGIHHFFLAIIIMVLVANVATSFGYLVSSVSSTVNMALSIGPPVIIPFLLFGGFLLNIRSIPNYFSWLSYLSWFRYGNEALLVNQWSDIEHIECNAVNSTFCPKNGELVLEIYDFRSENLLLDLIALFFLVLLFRFLAFSALFSKTLRT